MKLATRVALKAVLAIAGAAFVVYSQLDHSEWYDQVVGREAQVDMTTINTEWPACKDVMVRPWSAAPGPAREIAAEDQFQLLNAVPMTAVHAWETPRQAACRVKISLEYYSAVLDNKPVRDWDKEAVNVDPMVGQY